jgi:hypothetical protein
VLICAILVLTSYLTGEFYAAAEAEPYYIWDEDDFLDFATQVNEGDDFEGQTIILKRDIYLYQYKGDQISSTYLIGNFQGKFDGNNHAIVGLKSTSIKVLFDQIMWNGKVENLNIVNFELEGDAGSPAAGLANVNLGIIQNVKVFVKLKNYGAGIALKNYRNILNSFVYIETLSDSTNIYGLVGKNYYTEPAEDGGKIEYPGFINGVIYCAMNEGTPITLESIMGYDDWVANGSPDIDKELYEFYTPVTDSYLNENKITDIFDLLYFKTITGVTVEQTKELNMYNSNIEIPSSDPSYINSYYGCYNSKYATASNYPTFEGQNNLKESSDFPSGSGTSDDPYMITSYEHLNKIDELEQNNETTVQYYYELANDIYLFQDNENSTNFYEFEIDNLNGVLDGAGFAIIGKMIYSGASDSIINIGVSGTIKDLIIKTELPQNVTSFIGTNSGTINRVDFITNFQLLTQQSIIGANTGTIESCSIMSGTDFSQILSDANISLFVVNENSGAIKYVRSEIAIPFNNVNNGLLNFVYSDGSISIQTSTQISNSISNSYTVEDTTSYDDVREFILKYTSVDKFISHSYGIIAGSSQDKVRLTFYRDNDDYKQIKQLAFNDYEVEYTGDNILGVTKNGNYVSYELFDIMSEWGDLEGYKFYLTYQSDTTLIDDQTTIVNRGIYTIFASYCPDEELIDTLNYTKISKKANVTINKKVIIIKSEDYKDIAGVYYQNFPLKDSKIYDGTSIGATYFKISKIPENANFKVDIITFTTHDTNTMHVDQILFAGFYTLKLTATDPNDNYEVLFRFNPHDESLDTNLDFCITRSEGVMTISVSNSIRYKEDIKDSDLVYTFKLVSNGETIDASNYDKAEVSYDTNYSVGAGVGQYTITPKLKGTGSFSVNYFFNAGAAQTFYVIQAKIPGIDKLIFKDVTINFDGYAHSIVPAQIPEGNQYSYTTAEYSNAGVYPYNIKITNSDSGYEVFEDTVYLTIKPVKLTVTVNSVAIKYLEIPMFSVKYSAPGFESTPPGINAEKIFTYVTNYDQKYIGKYDVAVDENDRNVSFTLDILGKNYENITFESGVLTVGKGTLNIILNNSKITYTGSEFEPNLSAEIENKDYLDKINLEYYFEDEKLDYSPTNAGKYVLKIFLSDMVLFEDKEYSHEFEIEKARLSITGNFVVNSTGTIAQEILVAGVFVQYNTTEHGIDLSDSLKHLIQSNLKNTTDELLLVFSANFNGEELNKKYQYKNNSGFINNPLKKSIAGVFTDIKVEISGDNYEQIVLNALGTVTIETRKLRLSTNTLSETYTATSYSPIINFEFGYDIQYPDTHVGVYTIKIFSNGYGVDIDKIIDAKKYSININIINTNYEFDQGASNIIELTIKKHNIEIDLEGVDTFTRTYGDSTAIEHDVTYYIGAIEFNNTVTLRVNSGATSIGLLKPGTYDVIATNVFDNVEFSIKNGIGKYQVNKKELVFDWAPEDESWHFDKSHIYNGQIIYSKETTINEDYWSTTNQKPAGAVDVLGKVVFINYVKDVGDYQAVLSVNNDYYTVRSDYETFSISITKLKAELKLNDANIKYSDALPLISGVLTPNYELNDLGYTITNVVFEGYDEVSGIPGTYLIKADALSNNYDISVIGATLTVELAEFRNVTYNDQTISYDIVPYEPVILGLPDAATVSNYIPTILDVGEYIITVKINKAYFEEMQLQATIKVIPVNVSNIVLKTDTKIAYTTDELPMPTGEVYFKDIVIEGIFTYIDNPTKQLGIYFYDIKFIPMSENYAEAVNLKYSVECYVKTEDIQIITQAIKEDDEYILPMSIAFKINDAYTNVTIYINDELVDSSGVFIEITEPGSYNVRIFEGEYLIFEDTIKIKNQSEINVPDDGDEPSENGDENDITKNPEKKSIINILWIALGVGCGIILIIILAVGVQRKRLKGRKRNVRRRKTHI